VRIGGVDTSTLGVTTTRRGLAMIPQDPVLFQASVRFNLDPHDEYSDEEIWAVLAELEVRKLVEALPESLGTTVSEGGSNFSVGERQLLCLARAMLRSTKVLLLDEATASVDFATDARIQRTLRGGRFKDATLLVVAHRLLTILDCDRILVMAAGEVAEMDTPQHLYAAGGVFTRLVDDAGAAPALEQLASGASILDVQGVAQPETEDAA
jgi:ABC-type multidrug transport system fused ATPase/permease subunit